MSAHTEGRLTTRIDPPAELSSNWLYSESKSYKIAIGILTPDARRLAACWNHCEGIDTDTMEAGLPMLERVGLYIKDTDQLRADLAAARALLAEVSAGNDKRGAALAGMGMDGMSEPERGLAERIRALLKGGA